jgi:hypothetical protein
LLLLISKITIKLNIYGYSDKKTNEINKENEINEIEKEIIMENNKSGK